MWLSGGNTELADEFQIAVKITLMIPNQYPQISDICPIQNESSPQ